MKLMRYMSVEKYEDLLSTRKLFFPRYNQFEDEFEGSLGYVPPNELINEYTERLDRILSMRLPGKASAQEFLDAFEPALYNNLLRNFTFVSCWHQGEQESPLMWKAYAPEGVIIKSDLSSLKSSLGINAKGYQCSEEFWNDHGTEALNKYKVSIEVDEVRYRPLGHKIRAVGSERYFHKQAVYKEENELRVVLQVHLGARQRYNYPYALSNFPEIRDNSELSDLVLRFWEDTKRSYDKHFLILDEIFQSPGCRCRVSIDSLIKEVVVNPGGDISEIESLNQEYGLTAEVKKSIIVTNSPPTAFKINLPDNRTIEFKI